MKTTGLLQVPVTWTCTPPQFVLQEESTRVDFCSVAMGTRSTSVLHLLNTSAEDVDIYASLLNPVGPFSCPLGSRRVGPGQVLLFPVTFRPQVAEEPEQEILELRGNSTVLALVLCGIGIEHRVVFRPDQRLYQFAGNKQTFSLEIRNQCAATLPIRILEVFARQGPELKGKGPKPKSKVQGSTPKSKDQGPEPKSKGQGPAPKSKGQGPSPKNKGQGPAPKNNKDVEAILEDLAPAESAFCVEPQELALAADQMAVFKVEYQARAARTVHAARFRVMLGASTDLRDITFLATSSGKLN